MYFVYQEKEPHEQQLIGVARTKEEASKIIYKNRASLKKYEYFFVGKEMVNPFKLHFISTPGVTINVTVTFYRNNTYSIRGWFGPSVKQNIIWNQDKGYIQIMDNFPLATEQELVEMAKDRITNFGI